MKTLKITSEHRAYTEGEARDYIEQFRALANTEGYIVKSAGWQRCEKKKKGEVIGEAWIVKCVAVYNEIWDEEEFAE